MSKFYLTYLLFFACSIIQSMGQAPIDLNLYPESEHDSLAYENFKSLRESDTTEALRYVLLSYELAKKYNHIPLLIKASNGAGFIYQNQKPPDFEKALVFHNESLSLAKENNRPDRVMFTYNNLAFIHIKLDVLDKALDYQLKALEISKQLNNTEVENISLNNIGVIYGKLKNYQQAVHYCSLARELIKSKGVAQLDESYLNLGFYYTELKQYPEAEVIFKEFAISDSEPNLKTAAYIGLSRVYFAKGDISLAKKYSEMAVNDVSTEPNFYIQASITLAKSMIKSKDFEKAKSVLNKAESKAVSEKSLLLLQDVYEQLSEIAFLQDKPVDAYKLLQKANIMRDSVFSKGFAENFKNVHLLLEREKAEKIISEKNQSLSNSKRTVIAMSFVVVLLFIMIIMVYKFNKSIREKNGQLSQAKQLVDEVNKDLERRVEDRNKELNSRTKELLDTNAELDALIYKSYHDLKGPIARLKGLSTLTKMDPENFLEYNEGISKTTDQLNANLLLIQRITEINKHQVTTVVVDLPSFVGENLDKLRLHNNRSVIQFSMSLGVKSFCIDQTLFEQAFYAILQNAYDYARVNRGGCLVNVNSWQENNVVFISISDNGIGIPKELEPTLFGLFEKGEVASGSGLGLHLAKRAMEKAGGNLSFVRDEMTTFLFSIPNDQSNI